MRRSMYIGAVFALWSVFAMYSPALAGTVGKVIGKVADAKGEPLPGANVVLEGIRKGAMTDATGSYLILSVDPGVYSATASLIGFHAITKKEVRVQADFTTTVDFQLQEQAVEMAEMVVAAERPPVEPDKTESRYVVTARDIAQTPILRNVTDFVALEPGMAKDGSGVIRIGEIAHNAIFVDGIRLQNQDGRGFTFQNQWWGINVKAVQEISVITGGMNAEYGNAQAGVVNMVTRDGSEKYHGEFEYRLTPAGQKHWGANVYDAPEHRGHMQWNNPDWVAEIDPKTGRLVHQRLNYTDWRGHYFGGNVSGPLTRSAYFFFSAVHQRDAAVVPGPWRTRLFNLRTTSKLTVPAGSNVKLRFGWVYDRSEDFQGGSLPSTKPGRTGQPIPNVLRGSGRDVFLLEGSPGGKAINTEHALYAVLTHTLNPKTFYELRVSRYVSKQDTSGAGSSTSEVRADKEGWFYIGLDQMMNNQVGEQRRTGLKLDLSSQVSKGHFVKAGVDFTAYNNWLTWRVSTPGNKRKEIEYIGSRATPGKPIKPRQLALYLQDKMEFQGLVINAGVRYDRFWGVDVPLISAFRAFIYNSMSRFMQAPFFPMKPIVNWSPRLGISHPITSRSALHFFYGRFYQLPSLLRMFHEEWAATGAGIPGVPYSEYNLLGRPSAVSAVRPIYNDTQRTISFEVGADWNFVRDYTVTLSTFFKSASFQEGNGWTMLNDPVTQARRYSDGESNDFFHNVRGFEFSMRKDFSHHFSFRAAFDLEWADQGRGSGGDVGGGIVHILDSTFVATSPYYIKWEEGNGFQRPVRLTEEEKRKIGSSANSLLEKFLADPQPYVFCYFSEGQKAWENSRVEGEAKQAAEGVWYAMDYCPSALISPKGRGGQGSLQVFFSSPPVFGPGPKIARSTLLGGVSANLIYRIYTGSQFRYLTLDNRSQWGRGPLHTAVDLNVQKRLSFGRLNADLFLEVFNLFNQKDTAVSGTDYTWWGLQAPRPDDANYRLYGDFLDRTRYLDRPRISHVGVRLSF